MQSLYSIVIHPSEDIIALVKTMKEELAEAIGWFNSKNSIAHITINEFEADAKAIERIKKQLLQITDALEPVTVHFDGYGSYPNNGAFFIAPDTVSKQQLKVIMKAINDGLTIKAMFKSSEPHLSIARRLTPEKTAIANSIFTTMALHFLCDSVVLRKFNAERKQFDVTDTFQFNSNKQTAGTQGSLF